MNNEPDDEISKVAWHAAKEMEFSTSVNHLTGRETTASLPAQVVFKDGYPDNLTEDEIREAFSDSPANISELHFRSDFRDIEVITDGFAKLTVRRTGNALRIYPGGKDVRGNHIDEVLSCISDAAGKQLEHKPMRRTVLQATPPENEG